MTGQFVAELQGTVDMTFKTDFHVTERRVELPDNTIYSSGYIDLRREDIGFAFRTRRKSLFDWSAISIIKYAEVGGFLSQPNIGLNERELVKQGILSASSAAWGPLPSLVYSLGEAGLRNRESRTCRRSID